MVISLQVIGYAFIIFQQGIARPETVPAYMVEITTQLHFMVQLRVYGIHVGSIHRTCHVLTDVEMTSVGMIVPPINQCLDTCGLMTYLPIKLR